MSRDVDVQIHCRHCGYRAGGYFNSVYGGAPYTLCRACSQIDNSQRPGQDCRCGGRWESWDARRCPRCNRRGVRISEDLLHPD